MSRFRILEDEFGWKAEPRRMLALVLIVTISAGIFVVLTSPPVEAPTWTQTTRADFESGRRVQIDTTTQVDNFMLAGFRGVKGMLVYHDAADNENAKFIKWDDSTLTWSSEDNALRLLGGDKIHWIRVVSGAARENENSKNEKIMGVQWEEFTAADNRLTVMVWDGSAWGNSFENVIFDRTDIQQFDIAYEQAPPGRAMVVYGVGTSIPKYRLWRGPALGWSAEADVGGIGTTGTIHWVALASRLNDNKIICVTADSNADLNATIWDGSSWGDNAVLETALDTVLTGRCFDAIWDRQSRRAMVAWGEDVTGDLESRIWDPTLGWLGENLAFTSGGGITWVKLAAQPRCDNIMAGITDLVGADFVQTIIWDGSVWRENVIHGGDLIVGLDQQVWDIAFESLSGQALLVWSDVVDTATDDNVHYKTWDPVVGWSTTGYTIEAASGLPRWMTLTSDPQTDEIMLVFISDGTTPDITYNRWTGSAWVLSGTGPTLETNSLHADARRFDFAWTDTSGYLISSSCDSGSATVNWENIEWSATVPSGTTLKFRTRVSPDNVTWSAWSDWYTSSPSVITSADNNRYLQYQAWLETDNIANTPVVDNVSILYTVPVVAEWRSIETWTGTVRAPAGWSAVETWTGTVRAPAEWQAVETWTGTVRAPAAWFAVETWTGTVRAPAEWSAVETWTGTVRAPAEWSAIETWSGTVRAPAEWSAVETWTGTVRAPAVWQAAETWTGTVRAPVWQSVETWTGTVRAPVVEWKIVETWTGSVRALVPPVVVPPVPTVLITIIPAGASVEADFKQFQILVLEVGIEAIRTVENVLISIEVADVRPEVPPPPESVYKYLKITAQNITQADIARAVLSFRVERFWVARYNVDESTVTLLRFAGAWERLPTRLIGSDASHFYYEAETPGFSVFAIVWRQRAPAPAMPIEVPGVELATLAMATAVAGFAAVYSSLTWRLLPFISLSRLRSAAMRGIRSIKRVEVDGFEVASALEQLKRAAEVERVERPIPPLLKELKREVVWKPKRRGFKVRKSDIALVERLRKIANENNKRRRWIRR